MIKSADKMYNSIKPNKPKQQKNYPYFIASYE